MKPQFELDRRPVGDGLPPYMIAELSANHNGRLDNALRAISAAKAAGADAVKLQTYTADSMTIRSDRPEFRIRGGLWDGYTLYELYEEAHTPYAWHKPLFEHAAREGITLFSSPFDESAVDLLEDLHAPAYKIASFEATDLPLVRYAASTGKPIIASTGMADEEEIAELVATVRDAGNDKLILLHCISSYPAPPEQANLRTIPDMRQRFAVPVGLSDHTLTHTTALAATALGACAIEKHFTPDRSDKGPDSAFSLEPHELAELCEQSRVAYAALGQAGYERREAEKGNLQFRRSLYFVKDLAAGETITAAHLRRIRPGLGMAPRHYDEVIGCQAARAIAAGTPVTPDCLG
ncbi:pseudaminic acid synthase [Granulosicoccaceae sp. 1_MG-2023]|nr:pseudaminic acid synthase [Granulosicoccaceae sp. 1_MG-2023]